MIKVGETVWVKLVLRVVWMRVWERRGTVVCGDADKKETLGWLEVMPARDEIALQDGSCQQALEQEIPLSCWTSLMGELCSDEGGKTQEARNESGELCVVERVSKMAALGGRA